MTVFVFGNSDLDFDSMPLRIVGDLRKQFPKISFGIKDPNEDWPIPDDLVVIDTVRGIDQITIFDDLDQFQNAPRAGLHDFDALFHLRHLQKLGKIKKIKIIGLPPTISQSQAVKGAGYIIASLL